MRPREWPPPQMQLPICAGNDVGRYKGSGGGGGGDIHLLGVIGLVVVVVVVVVVVGILICWVCAAAVGTNQKGIKISCQ
jgi:hypothetical protein